MIKAFCDRRGVIGFTANTVPVGMMPIVAGPADAVRHLMEVRARHAHTKGVLLVPGVPEAKTEEAALKALARFIDWIKDCGEMKRVLSFSDEGAESPAFLPTAAVSDVIAERRRQVVDEGFDAVHDDCQYQWELPRAAYCYLNHYICRAFIWRDAYEGYQERYREEAHGCPASDEWPWLDSLWKPKTPRRDLVRAAALIIAEIERLDRAEGLANE